MPRHASCILIALLSLSCTSDRIENAWLNPRPAEAVKERWQELTQARFREVTGDMRAEAVQLLAAEPVQRLPGRDVHRFVGADFSDQPSGRFYLLRAVTAGQNGSYQILTRGRTVTVRYNALGGGNTTTVQSAVVADLEQAPERVYVEISVAQ